MVDGLVAASRDRTFLDAFLRRLLLIRLPTLLILGLHSFVDGLLLPRVLLQLSAFLGEGWLSSRLEWPSLGTETSWTHERLGVVIWPVALRWIARVRVAFVDLVVESL